MDKIILNIAGITGTRFEMGAFFADGSFRRKVGNRSDGSCTWALAGLPERFRTQLDVNSTLDAFGGRKVAGAGSTLAIDGRAAVAWKAGREWDLEGLVTVGKLTVAQAQAIRTYYASETLAAA